MQVIFNNPKHKKYTFMDLRLLKAFKLYDRFMAGGAYPIWIDRSSRVNFEAKTFISGSAAAIQRAEANDTDKATGASKAPPGTQYYAVPKVKDGGKMPTFREWLEEKETQRKSREEENPNIQLKRPLDPFGNPQ